MVSSSSPEQVEQVLSLLHSGLTGRNSLAVQQQLKQFQRDPAFALALCAAFVAPECPVPLPAGAALVAPWAAYRRLAGLTLKNAIAAAGTALGEGVFNDVGTACLGAMWHEPLQEIVSVAAAVVVKMTCAVGMEWWATLQVDLGDQVLNQLLGHADPVRVIGALTCLEYFFEDGASHLGEGIQSVLQTVCSVANSHEVPKVRHRAFTLAFRAYEVGEDYEWNVEALQPIQRGLQEAGLLMAQCVAAVVEGDDARHNERMMITAMRAAASLLHYLDVIRQLAGSGGEGELDRMFASWVRTACGLVDNAAAAPDVATEACHFLSQVATVCHRTAGEGAIGVLAEHLDNHETIAALVERLFPCMLMKDEEVQELVENDHFEKRDMVGHRSALSKKATRGDADKADDGEETQTDDVVLANLRSAASHVLYAVCKLNPPGAFPPVLRVLQAHWGSSEWQFREVSMLALGCVANGAYDQCTAYLPALIPQLCEVIETETEAEGGGGGNFILSSTAIFTLALFSSWVIQCGDCDLTARAIRAILGRFCSTSKRVQHSAVSAFRTLASVSLNLSHGSELIPFGELIVTNLFACVAVYHGNNLALLADLVAEIAFLLVEVPDVCAQIESHLEKRYGEFLASFEARYDREDANQLVNTDVVHISSMLAALYESMPAIDPAKPQQQLDVWVGVLQMLAERDITDDAALIIGPLHLLSYFVQCLDTNNLMQWHAGNNGAAVTLCIAYSRFDNEAVRLSCLDVIYRLLMYLGPGAAADAAQILAMLPPLLSVEDEMSVALDATSVLHQVCKAFGTSQPALRLAAAQVAQVRSDAFGSALDAHAKLACRVAAILQMAPTTVDAPQLAKLAEVGSHSPNCCEDKAAGTVGIMAAFCALQSREAMEACMRCVLRLIASWQTQAAAEVLPAIRAGLHFARDNAPDLLNGAVTNMPPSTRAQLAQLYDL